MSATIRRAISAIVSSLGLPRFIGPVTSSGRFHQPHERVDHVVDVTERTRLPAVAEDRDRLVAQRLDDESGDHAAVGRMHVGAVGVEDARDLDPQPVLAVIVEEQRLGAALSLVVAGALADRVDAPPVVLGLRMHLGVAVDLAGRRLQDRHAQPLREPEHVDRAVHGGLRRLHGVVLVVDRRRRAGEVVDPVDLDVERERDVVAQRARTRDRRAGPTTLSRVPVKKLSAQMTWQPSFSSRAHRWEPRNPAPPVTSTRNLPYLGMSSPGRRVILRQRRRLGTSPRRDAAPVAYSRGPLITRTFSPPRIDESYEPGGSRRDRSWSWRRPSPLASLSCRSSGWPSTSRTGISGAGSTATLRKRDAALARRRRRSTRHIVAVPGLLYCDRRRAGSIASNRVNLVAMMACIAGICLLLRGRFAGPGRRVSRDDDGRLFRHDRRADAVVPQLGEPVLAVPGPSLPVDPLLPREPLRCCRRSRRRSAGAPAGVVAALALGSPRRRIVWPRARRVGTGARSSSLLGRRPAAWKWGTAAPRLCSSRRCSRGISRRGSPTNRTRSASCLARLPRAVSRARRSSTATTNGCSRPIT